MVTSIKQIIVIIILSLVLGIVRNSFLDEPLSLIKEERILDSLEVKKGKDGIFIFELPEDLTEPLMVNIDAVDYLRNLELALIIDARDEEEFINGRISGSINIPYDYYEDFEFQLDEIDLEKILIIYCSGGECSLSIDLADYLMMDRGFFNVLVYEGGWLEWKNSRLPTE